MFVQLVAIDGAPQARVLRDLVADDQEFQAFEPFEAHQMERFDQPLEVLVGFDVPHVQHERAVQLVTLAGVLDLRGVRLLEESFVDRVVDHRHTIGRHAAVTNDIGL